MSEDAILLLFSCADFMSRRHIDIRMLPSIVPSIAKNATARIIEPELSARIAKLKTLIDAGVIDQDVSTGGQSDIVSR